MLKKCNWLVAGLGNPGGKYRFSRHNAGFMAVDFLMHRMGLAEKMERSFSYAFNPEETLCLIKPMMYMNLSGESIELFLKRHGFSTGNIIVFHDDKDIELGRIRLKTGGGCAGHNGIQNIVDTIGNDFIRVRIGIQHPGHLENRPLRDFVLEDFHPDEHEVIRDLIQQYSCDIVNDIREKGFLFAQSRIHSLL